MNTNSQRFESFTSAVIKAYKRIHKIKSVKATSLGMKPNHVLYVFYFGNNPQGLTPSDLVRMCNEDKAAVSRALSELVSLGVIQKTERSVRKYKTKYCITEQGKAMVDEIESAIGKVVSKASEGLTDSERKCFYSVFSRIMRNLEDICQFDD